jgi:hypothetical protein
VSVYAFCAHDRLVAEKPRYVGAGTLAIGEQA